MNIYSPPGTLIVYVHPDKWADKFLERNHIYTVEKTDVQSWYTDVYLREHPGIRFNSVIFEPLSAWTCANFKVEGEINVKG